MNCVKGTDFSFKNARKEEQEEKMIFVFNL